jgi:serine/threonine-protein kinase
MADEHQRAHEIFLRAAALAPAEREAFLDLECAGDGALRQRVQALLSQQDETGDVSRMAMGPLVTERSQPDDAAGPERFTAGDVFAERYRIVTLLGRGGMGEVYRAHDQVLDVPVAVKFLRTPNPEYRERMLHEVRLARAVTHATVCRVYDVGEVEGQLYFTMEYVDGEDLASLITRIGRLPPDKVVEIAQQILAGLAAAHAKGVIHRDLKPANVMIDGAGRVRVTDFGVAVLEHEAAGGGLAGTPAYMAPEQLTGGDVGTAADLYSVGLVLHELITGQPAYSGGSFTELLKLKFREPPTPPLSSVAGVDEELQRAIARATAPAPEDRFQSALAMAAALPGGDPLAMAVEAGATLDPSLLAAATVRRRIPNPVMWGMCAGMIALLAAVVLLADPSSDFDDLRELKPPEVLADRAGQMLDELGLGRRSVDRDWGFLNDPIAPDPASAVLFWYRERTERDVPDFVTGMLEVFSLATELEVPDEVGSEATLVMLDHSGRLVYLHDGPMFGASFAADSKPGGGFDWSSLLKRAGLGGAALASEKGVRLPVFSDVQAAWQGSDPDRSDGRIRVEAAAFDGRPVYFSVEQTDDRSSARWQQLRRRSRLHRFVYSPLYALVALGALVLGVSNVVRGSSHLRGAAELMIVVLIIQVVATVLTAGRAPQPFSSAKLALIGDVFLIFATALVVGLCYLGLEPFVRRRRPQNLIAWTRLLSGRFRDRSVGGSLLVGAAAGAGLALLGQLDRVILALAGVGVTASSLTADRLNAVLGQGQLLGVALQQVYSSIVAGLLMLFLIAFLLRLLPWRWFAVSIFVLIIAVVTGIQDGAHLPLSVVTLGLPSAFLVLFVLDRFGLLTVVTASFAASVLSLYPMTLERGAWFAFGGYFAIGLALAIGGLGFLLASMDVRESTADR